MDPRLWLVLGLLIGGVIVTAYAARVAPSSPRDRRALWIALTFLFWMLAGFHGLRSG